MQAFHDDPELKNFVLGQLAQHREADRLVKGHYWERGKGCAVGCTLEAVRLRNKKRRIEHGSHALYEGELGIPRVLAFLEDRIFERLPNGDSQRWPERFISAIAPGADLTLVWPRLALWHLAEELPPRVSDKHPKTRAALDEIAALFREWTETGKNPDRARWVAARGRALEARRAAYAYAAAAAYAYAAAAAAYAYAAAAAAAAADADAAYAAAAAYAYAAAYAADAYDEAIRRQADKLIELLRSAPMR